MQPLVLPALLIVGGGVAIALQAPLNAALGRAIGSGLGAAAVSFGLGFVALAVLTVATSGTAPFARAATVSPVLLLGGFLGAFYVWSVINGVVALGVVTAIAAMILGQVTAAVLLDMAGAFGVPVQPLTWKRVAAVALVAAGLVLSRA